MNQGIHNLTDEVYHQDPCTNPSLSSGTIKRLVNESPRHAWFNHPRLNPAYQSEESSKFDLGTAAHALILQGINRMEVIDAEALRIEEYRSKNKKIPEDGFEQNWQSKVARLARDDARSRGMVPLLKNQSEDVLMMVGAFHAAIANCPDLSGITLADGKAEQAMIWQDGNTWCRSKPDWRSNDGSLIIDYKTTSGSASPAAAERQIMNQMDGDIQAAFYVRGNKAICGVDAQFIFAVQESSAPYAVSFIGVSPVYMALGDDKCRVGISLFSECLARNEWPGYERRINWSEPKAWQLGAWAEKQNMEAAHGESHD